MHHKTSGELLIILANIDDITANILPAANEIATDFQGGSEGAEGVIYLRHTEKMTETLKSS